MATDNSFIEVHGVNEPLKDVQIVKTSCRKRKPNFSAQEIAVITEKFEENQAVLKSKFTNKH